MKKNILINWKFCKIKNKRRGTNSLQMIGQNPNTPEFLSLSLFYAPKKANHPLPSRNPFSLSSDSLLYILHVPLFSLSHYFAFSISHSFSLWIPFFSLRSLSLSLDCLKHWSVIGAKPGDWSIINANLEVSILFLYFLFFVLCV